METLPRVIEAAAPLPMILTKRAFIARFPLMPDGVSNKFSAMDLYLRDNEYAGLLTPDQEQRIGLRMRINTGLLFLRESGNVNYAMPDAVRFLGMMALPDIPAPFRLTEAERDAILHTPIHAGERP